MATEKQKIQEINNMFSIAKEGIAPQRREWLSRYKYWRGKEEIPRPKRRDNVTIPMVFMITDGIMSFLTDSAPRIKFLPQEETDLQVADWLNQIVGDYYWDKLNMYRVSEEVLWWAMSISGSGLAKWGIDTLSNEFYVKACNSFACFPDPNALNLKTCEFFHHAEVRTLKDIIRIYGAERGREVHMQPELNILAYETDDIIAPWGRTSYKSENLSEVWKDAQFKKDMGKAMVLETWMKDDTKIPIPFNPDEVAQEHEMIRQGQMPSVTVEQNHPAHLENHQNMVDYFTNNPEISSEYLQLLADHIELHLQEPQESYRLKYPKGKIITTANGVLLEEQNAPFGLPYSKMDFIINPREFWSVTLQEYIQPLQNSLTRGYRTISDIADRCSSPREFINIMSGVDFEKITGEAGESVPVKGDPRMAVAWEQLPNIPNLLKVVCGTPHEELRLYQDEVLVIETNVDDVTGETLGYLVQELLNHGAKDVSIISTTTKKNRPGHLLSVIATPEDEERLAYLLIAETGSLGVRVSRRERHLLARETQTATIQVNDQEFTVRVKIATDRTGKIMQVKAEYEDVKTVAEKTGQPLMEIAQQAEAVIRSQTIQKR